MVDPLQIGRGETPTPDYSALAILEMKGADKERAEFHCRHLQRRPLKTPYPK